MNRHRLYTRILNLLDKEAEITPQINFDAETVRSDLAKAITTLVMKYKYEEEAIRES